MFKWLGRVLGSTEGTKSLFGMVDDAFHTAQEQGSLRLKFLRAYEPFRVAQRAIAVSTTIVFLLSWTITFILSFWIDVEKQQLMISTSLLPLMETIYWFYFLGGAAEGGIRAFMSRKEKAAT